MLYLWLMDNELAKRWLKLPEVEVEYCENILLANKKIISIPDITPEMLSDYIEIGHQAINDHLLELRKRNRYLGEPRTRPLVLIGRLALADDESEVFTKDVLSMQNDANVTIDQVNQAYRGYWSVIEQSIYVPVVRRNMVFDAPQLNGAWLGLRRP